MNGRLTETPECFPLFKVSVKLLRLNLGEFYPGGTASWCTTGVMVPLVMTVVVPLTAGGWEVSGSWPEVGGITAVVVTGVSALVTVDVSGAAVVVVETLCEESVDSGVADCLTLILC